MSYFRLTPEVRHSRRGRVWTTERTYEVNQSEETETRGGCCLDRFVGPLTITLIAHIAATRRDKRLMDSEARDALANTAHRIS